MASTGDHPDYERITLKRWRDFWVAVDESRGLSSSPMETRHGALDDLDETVAIAEGELTLSDETTRQLDRSVSSRDKAIPLEETER